MTTNLRAGAANRQLSSIGSLALAAAFLSALATAPGVRAQTPAAAPIKVELNKLEPIQGTDAAVGCRVYIVATNPDADSIPQLRLDIILFGNEGIIARRVALDLGPLTPHKTAVRLFDLAGQPCEGISRVLVNDVLACQEGPVTASADPRQGCLDRLQLSSRGKVEFDK